MAILAHLYLRAEGRCVVSLTGDTFQSKEKIKEIGFRWIKSDSETPLVFPHWEKTCFEASSLMATITELSALGVGLFAVGDRFEDFDGELVSLLRKKEGH